VENHCGKNTSVILHVNPSDNKIERRNQHPKIHNKPRILLQNIVLIGIWDEKERQMPERPNRAEYDRLFVPTAIVADRVLGVASPQPSSSKQAARVIVSRAVAPLRENEKSAGANWPSDSPKSVESRMETQIIRKKDTVAVSTTSGLTRNKPTSFCL
jgi:hypothetical protein